MKLMKSHAEEIAESGVWRKKFAFFPTFMSDGSLIWLEGYEAMDEWYADPRFSCWKHNKRLIERTECIGTNSAGPGGPVKKEKTINAVQ